MAVSAYPAVVDAIVAAATTALPDVIVSDGEAVTTDPGDALVVGSNNATDDGTALAGESRQTWANAGGTSRDEEGEVNCLAVAWNGDGDAKAARDAAFAIVEAVAGVCRANPSLGVATVLWTSFGTRTAVTQVQTDGGAACAVEFQITYRARI